MELKLKKSFKCTRYIMRCCKITRNNKDIYYNLKVTYPELKYYRSIIQINKVFKATKH